MSGRSPGRRRSGVMPWIAFPISALIHLAHWPLVLAFAGALTDNHVRPTLYDAPYAIYELALWPVAALCFLVSFFAVAIGVLTLPRLIPFALLLLDALLRGLGRLLGRLINRLTERWRY